MKTVTINLFSFDELNQEAQKKAINDHAEFLLKVVETDGEEYNREEVVENILLNEYLFFEDGELAHTVQYTGRHPKAGKLEFHFHNKVIELN